MQNYKNDLAYRDMVCENPTFTENAKSLLSCANLCSQHKECEGICFNHGTKICIGCLGKYNRVYRSDTGFTFYDILLETTTTVSTTPVPTTPTTCSLTRPVRQWVQTVTAFSSEYTRYPGWEPAQVIGAPDVYPRYGDLEGSWTPNVKDSKQFIEVQFAEAVCITGVEIYETYFAGAVKAVKAKDGNSWITLWSTSPVQVLKYARIFSPPLSIELMTSPTKDLRIEVDVSASNNWVELDAIQLQGNK